MWESCLARCLSLLTHSLESNWLIIITRLRRGEGRSFKSCKSPPCVSSLLVLLLWMHCHCYWKLILLLLSRWFLPVGAFVSSQLLSEGKERVDFAWSEDQQRRRPYRPPTPVLSQLAPIIGHCYYIGDVGVNRQKLIRTWTPLCPLPICTTTFHEITNLERSRKPF